MGRLWPHLTMWNIILKGRRKINKGCKVQGNGQMKINWAITNYRKPKSYIRNNPYTAWQNREQYLSSPVM